MNIDLTRLVTNICEEIIIDDSVVIPEDMIKDSGIRKLKNTCFEGSIVKLCNEDYSIEGVLTGTMVLEDAVTLEDVDYEFSTDISEEFDEFGEKFENYLKIIKNTLDITEFLWQNILVEIPLKVVSEKNKDLKLEGDGWRLTTEDEIKLGNECPFGELKEKFNSRKE